MTGSSDFISANHIIAEVAVTVDDTAFRKGFSKGWFLSRIQDAMQELAMDTYFQKIQIDVEFPQNCQVKVPENCFNIREIYMYNGTHCNPNKTQNVYYKRLFNNNYKGDGYTAKVKDDGSNSGDLFVPNQSSGRNISSNMNYEFSGRKYYANEQNGVIMFSRDCASFPYVRIIFNGFGTPVGDVPIIPRFFEQAVKDWVEVAYWNAMKSRDPRKYRVLWADAKEKLEDLRTGSWNKARKRLKSMNSFEKESLEEYIGSAYHK